MHIKIPYSPRKEQREIHEALDKHRFAVLLCHRRFGKSYLSLHHLIRHAFRNPLPNPRYAYIAPTFKQGKSIAFDYLIQFTKSIPGVKVNASELKVDLPNGARISILSGEVGESIRGNYFDFCVIDEAADMEEKVFTSIILPALSDRKGGCLILGTPKGTNNFFYNIYKRACIDPKWYVKVYKVSETKLLDEEELQQLRDTMSDDEYRQELECDFSAAISGSVYGKIMEKMEDEGRIGNVPYDPGFKINTAWDLGVGDSTAIIFFYTAGRTVYICDYYETSDEGLPHFAKILEKKADELGYFYGDHIAPFDIEQRDFSNGVSRRETAYELGIRFRVAPKLSIEDGLHAASMKLNSVWMDREKCEGLIDALRHYHRKYNASLKVMGKPVHDWSSHGSDAFRTMCVAMDQGIGERKAPQQIAENNYDPLEVTTGVI